MPVTFIVLLALLWGQLFPFPGPGRAPAGGGSSDFSYKRSITIDNTKVPNTNQSNFPVLVNLTNNSFKTTGNGGNVTDAQGDDIVFFSDTNLTTQLDHEVEKYDGATGQIIAWIRVPTVSSSTDTVFWVGYGNSSITTSQENITGVWDSNFKAVWHMNEDPSGSAPQITDSTSNANHGTTGGSMSSGAQVAAKINNGLSLDGTNDFVGVATGFGQISTLSISVWFKTVQPQRGLLSIANATPPTAPSAFIPSLLITSGSLLRGEYWTGSQGQVVSSGEVNNDAWRHVVLVGSGTSQILYLDGVSEGSRSGTIDHSWWTATQLGTGYDTFGQRGLGDAGWFYFAGTVDEFRVSSTNRSADWIATEYNNQNSPGTFYTLGAEQ